MKSGKDMDLEFLWYAPLWAASRLCSPSPVFKDFFSRALFTLAEQIGEPTALIAAHADSTIVDFHEGRLRSVIEHGSRARDVCRKAGYPNLLFWALATNHAAIAHVHLADLDAALSLAGELVRMGEDTNDPFVRAWGFWPLIEVQDKKGRFEDCIANLQKSIEVCEAIQLHDGRVNSGYKLSRSYLRLGEIEKSLQALTQSDLYRIKHDSKLYPHFFPLATSGSTWQPPSGPRERRGKSG
jgi:tetratricopeptide (TPR) repeat protein